MIRTMAKLFTLAIVGTLWIASAAVSQGRTLTEQELWGVRGATTGWCKIRQSACDVGGVFDCETIPGGDDCAIAAEEFGSGGPYYRCGSVTLTSSCTETGSLIPCKSVYGCEWYFTDEYDSGNNPIYLCRRKDNWTSRVLSLTSDQVTGDACP